MDPVEFRAFGQADQATAVALLGMAMPWFDERLHGRTLAGEAFPLLHCEMAANDQSVVGVAFAGLPQPMNGMARALVVVDPLHRGRGHGHDLWQRLAPTIEDRDAMSTVRDDDPRSLDIASGWGFSVTQHSIGSLLDISPDLPRPARIEGVTIHRADTWFPPDPVGSAWEASDTSPEAELWGPAGPDTFADMFDSPVLIWLEVDGTVAAVVGCQETSSDHWEVIYTGTVPQFRGRGLARLLKQHMHAIAAEQGIRTVTTANEEENTAIRRLNADLGYRRTIGEFRVRRRTADL